MLDVPFALTATQPRQAAPRIAVLIPCYNEAVAIPRVVEAFRTALPDAAIHVYDNNSQDRTVQGNRVNWSG
jgi:Glycosyl transferase family 2